MSTLFVKYNQKKFALSRLILLYKGKGCTMDNYTQPPDSEAAMLFF